MSTEPTSPGNATTRATPPTAAEGASVAAAACPPVVSDAALEELAAKISPIARSATVDAAVAIGEILVDGIYDGRAPTTSAVRASAKTSLRALAERLGNGMSASKLSRCIGVYELLEDLGDVVPAQQLSLAHLEAVLPLPREEQRRLLNAASDGGWSKRELFLQVCRSKPSSPGRSGGRPMRRPVIKLLDLLVRFDVAEGLPKDMGDLTAESVSGAHRSVVPRARAVLAAIAAAFEEGLPPKEVPWVAVVPQPRAR